MLADDHAVVRRGLRTLIEGVPGWEVCAEASDGNETVALAADARPDILIMDLSMPGLGGVDATIQIRKMLPQIEVLILTMHESDRLALSRHQPYFSPSVSETLLQGYLHSEPAHDLKQLTPRERQIVKLVAEGKSNKVIASVLNLSIKTVETHRSAAMHKVGAKSAADLTLYAARNDLVQL
jgi:DNA-binding NarL/FixJ family response regulator